MNDYEGNESTGSMIVTVLVLVGIIGSVFWFSGKNEPEYFNDKDFDFSSYTTKKREYWDLSLYSSKNPNTDYLIDKITGFATRTACLKEGVKRRTRNGGSFECGYKCKTQYFTIEKSKDQVDICEKVCDDGGCRE